MIEIVLTNGMVAKVDDCDGHLLSRTWRAAKGLRGGFYATAGSSTLLHREVLSLKKGDPFVDHINGDTLDCRRQNLRQVTAGVNARNISLSKTNKTGFLGVTWRPHAQKWSAQIFFEKKYYHCGYYTSPEAANEARLAKEKELWGIQPRRAEAHKKGDPLDWSTASRPSSSPSRNLEV